VTLPKFTRMQDTRLLLCLSPSSRKAVQSTRRRRKRRALRRLLSRRLRSLARRRSRTPLSLVLRDHCPHICYTLITEERLFRRRTQASLSLRFPNCWESNGRALLTIKSRGGLTRPKKQRQNTRLRRTMRSAKPMLLLSHQPRRSQRLAGASQASPLLRNLLRNFQRRPPQSIRIAVACEYLQHN
jgi:hypothetical protein